MRAHEHVIRQHDYRRSAHGSTPVGRGASLAGAGPLASHTWRIGSRPPSPRTFLTRPVGRAFHRRRRRRGHADGRRRAWPAWLCMLCLGATASGGAYGRRNAGPPRRERPWRWRRIAAMGPCRGAHIRYKTGIGGSASRHQVTRASIKPPSRPGSPKSSTGPPLRRTPLAVMSVLSRRLLPTPPASMYCP